MRRDRGGAYESKVPGLLGLLLAACGTAVTAQPGAGVAVPEVAASAAALTGARVVISQVYGGGGNAGAPFKNDFVELFNSGDAPATLTGWSVQYTSAAGTGLFSQNTVALSGALAPGQHYLVQLAAGAGAVPALPAPDAVGTVNMSATAGKVLLADTTAGLPCNTAATCDAAGVTARILDLVGYGTGASGATFFEGTAAAPTLSNTTAALRRAGGCQDTGDNGADFSTGTPTPRNATDALAPCGALAAPAVTATVPAQGAAGVAPDVVLTLSFSEPVALAADALALACAGSAVATTVSGGPSTFTFTPAAPLAPGVSCTATLAAAAVLGQLTGAPLAADFTLGFTTEPTHLVVAIHDIQGRAHLSPLRGATVVTHGVVTALTGNGFYLQDPVPDDDDATSEALFVFTSSAPAVRVGDAVELQGEVSEFRPGCSSCGPTADAFANLTTTELVRPAALRVSSSGNSLPPPVVIGAGGRLPPTTVIEDDTFGDVEISPGVFDPAQDGLDFYESLEGMRVQVNDAVVVGPTRTFTGGSREIAVLPDGGAGAGTRTARGGIAVAPGDFNPERIILSNASVADAPEADVGDAFPGAIVGVVDYSFGNVKLRYTAPLPALVGGGLAREVSTLGPSTPARLDVATFNVENLDPGDPPAKFQRLADIVVQNLRAPDILSVEEVQDDSGPTSDGTVGAARTLQLLVDAIAAAGGPAYAARAIDPVDGQDGGEPGGNIRQAFLFRTDRGLQFVDRPGAGSLTPTEVVAGAAGPELRFSPGRIDPANPAFTSSRKPLAGQFTFQGQTLFVVANHFNSKGGDQPLFGRFQPPALGSERQRLAQAEVVAGFVRQLLAADAQAKVVVLGDLNDFEFSPPLGVLKAAGLVDLIEELPRSERYTYVFDGNSQVLDHVLVSAGLQARARGVDVVHVNAEFADHASDHDPVVARFSLDATPPLLTLPADLTAEATSAAGATVSFASSAADAVDGAVPVDCAPASGATFPLGTTAVTCTAVDGEGNLASGSFTVTVRDTTAPTISGVPATVAAFATSRAGAIVTYPAPTATDAVSGALPVTCAPAAGSLFAPGRTAVACTARDAAGLTGGATFDVLVTFAAPLDTSFFLAPIHGDGSTFFFRLPLPVRFRLTGPSASVRDLATGLRVAPVVGGVVGPARDGRWFLGLASRFVYEPVTRSYLFLLATDALGRGTWRLQVDLGDGVPHTVDVVLR